MKRIDSKTFEVDTGLDLVLDDCGHPHYAIVSTREGDPEWSSQQIEKALAREGYKVWCDTSAWSHHRDFSSVILHEGGYHENAAARAPRIGSRATIVNPDHRAAASLFEGAHVIVRGRKHFPDEFEVEFLDDGPNWTKGQKGWIAMRYVSPERQRKNGDVVDRGWRFRKTRTDPTWGPIPDMRTEGPVGKAGTVYEFNIKMHHALMGLTMTDEDFHIESEHAVQALADQLRERYPWVSEIYQAGRSGGWLAIKDRAGKAREKSLREISELVQQELKAFERYLHAHYSRGIYLIEDDTGNTYGEYEADSEHDALRQFEAELDEPLRPEIFARKRASEYETNASSYYVWPLNAKSEPLAGEGPFGPYPLDNAKTTARIRATKGSHDYAVTRGSDPSRLEFIRLYQSGTGRDLLERASCQYCGKDPGDKLHCQHCGHSTGDFID